MPKMMYNSLYAKRLPIGQKEILENFTYDKLTSFYKDWYRPNLMAVIVEFINVVIVAYSLVQKCFTVMLGK